MSLHPVVLSALFSGLVAIASTVAIERLGGRLGGLIATLPTTIVPATLGIYAQSATTADFQDAMAVPAVGMLINALYLFLWRVLPPRLSGLPARLHLPGMVLLTTSGWATAAALGVLGLAQVRAAGVPLLLAGAGFVVTTFIIGVLACRRAPPAPRGTQSVGPIMLLARGALAATAIGLAVWLAAVSGPLLAGMVAVFPAIFFTTMVGLWISQGAAVPAGAVGPMMLGSASVSAHALLAALALPLLGPAIGSLAAWTAAVLCVTAPAGWWLRRAIRAAPGSL